MNIAEICFSRAWGGLEHYVVDAALRLAEKGHTVIPVVQPGTPLEENLTTAGLQPESIKSRDYFSPRSTLRLVSLFKRYSVGAIHIHRTQDLGPALVAADIAKVSNRVFTLQMESSRRKRDVYHRWVYGRLSAVLTISERMRRLVIDNVAVDPRKVRCLYYGIDTEEIDSGADPKVDIREKWNISVSAFVIGMVGRIEKLKGQETVLRACSKLVGEIPELTIVFVGDETVGMTGEVDRLNRLAGELSPDLRVIFTGYRYPPGAIVPAFDLSVLASRKETFGRVVIEAQALGVPVIGTDAGGVPEIISDGENGLLFPPDDHDALAEAIQKLYRNPELRAKMGKAGRRNVEIRFSICNHMERLEAELGGGNP